MQQEIPIPTTHLFPILDSKLITLLRSLSAEEWNKPTIAKLWTVKDIAAHLLDGNIRTLSMARDGYSGVQPDIIASYRDLLDYLNRLNADWVLAMKRMSPTVLTDLLEATCKEFCSHIASLQPFAPAIFPVSWAGETKSSNWFHVAREYTEKWIHQQQIRDAVNKPGIVTKELFYPFIETLMQGLPHTYCNTHAETGTSVLLTISGEMGGRWLLVKNERGWQLSNLQTDAVTAAVNLEADTAWKLFSKGISPEAALEKTTITGDEYLGRIALSMVSVMA